ncbi:MAG: hypothetical protein WBA05_12585 [Gordonia sp. (in: high G+C Gram-positive bacteria)]|uniref:hypothetical protein n=1 Tax=Gordonia sp. (in: high G+C Gram-positive bacteria) TaxID=84139 RepID=UPI003C7634AE
MTDRPPHDPALETLVNDLWHARYADPRFGHEDFTPFPALIARADELGEDYWRFVVRLEAAYVALWSGTATDVLTLLAWMLRAHDAGGIRPALELSQLEQLHTTMVDFLESMPDVPELSLTQAEALLADWRDRVRGTEYDSTSLVRLVEAKIALHRGDAAQARRILDTCREFDPPTGTCEEGARASVAALYSRCGDYEQAIALSEPDLVDDGERCGFYPGETYAALIEAYAATGRRADVSRAAEAIDRVYGQFSGSTAHIVAIPALLRIGDLRLAHRLALSRLPHLDACFTDLDRAELAAAISAVLASVAASDPDAVVAHRVDVGRPAQLRSAAELAAELAEQSRDVARRFDIRNGGDAVSGRVEQLLALRAADPSAADSPTGRVKAVGDRTAAELMTGMGAFANVSTRRAAACAEALAGRVGELSGRQSARAQIMLAADLRRTDPAAASPALRAAAASARERYPSMAAQAELMADVEDVQQGRLEPERLLQAPPADPRWSALAQANYWRFVAIAVDPLDSQRAVAAVEAGLSALDRGMRGELPLADADAAADDDGPRSLLHGVSSIETALHLTAASVHAAQGIEPDADVDRALVAARRAVEAASTPDERLQSHAELSGALGFAAQIQAFTDEPAALQLMHEAVEHARYAQRALMLAHRAELRLAVSEDFDGAVADHEAAVAVWMVEGLDHQADAGAIDLARVQLGRGDEPLTIVETLRPIVDRMTERGDDLAVANALGTLGRAQVAAGLAADAVVSFTRVLDEASGHEHPGYLAELHQARAAELMDLGRFAEAIADFDTAIESFDDVGAPFELGDALRSAGLAAYFGGDAEAAASYLDRAARVYDEISVDAPVDFERARLDLARADVMRADRPARARALLDSVIERARAADWTLVTLSALQISALIAWSTGTDEGREEAVRLVDEGLHLDPEHPGLNRLAFDLSDEP